MGTWSITPSTASIDQNGKATFPKNTEATEKTYTKVLVVYLVTMQIQVISQEIGNLDIHLELLHQMVLMCLRLR